VAAVGGNSIAIGTCFTQSGERGWSIPHNGSMCGGVGPGGELRWGRGGGDRDPVRGGGTLDRCGVLGEVRGHVRRVSGAGRSAVRRGSDAIESHQRLISDRFTCKRTQWRARKSRLGWFPAGGWGTAHRTKMGRVMGRSPGAVDDPVTSPPAVTPSPRHPVTPSQPAENRTAMSSPQAQTAMSLTQAQTAMSLTQAQTAMSLTQAQTPASGLPYAVRLVATRATRRFARSARPATRNEPSRREPALHGLELF
jgi:hypothetical protein